MRPSLHPGVWLGSVSLWITGGIAATQSRLPGETQTYVLGAIAIALGLLLFVWGIKWDGRHWWDRPWLKLTAFRPRRGLYVGNIMVSDVDLNANHYLDLAIRAYNGTAQTVRYRGCTGTGRIEFANSPGGFDLQPPILIAGDIPCRSGEELTLSYRLVFTPTQVAEFRAMQTAGVTPQILFGRLAIWMKRRWGRPLRLPLWDGVSLQGALVGGRIVCAVGHASARGTASLE